MRWGVETRGPKREAIAALILIIANNIVFYIERVDDI